MFEGKIKKTVTRKDGLFYKEKKFYQKEMIFTMVTINIAINYYYYSYFIKGLYPDFCKSFASASAFSFSAKAPT